MKLLIAATISYHHVPYFSMSLPSKSLKKELFCTLLWYRRRDINSHMKAIYLYRTLVCSTKSSCIAIYVESYMCVHEIGEVEKMK